MSKGKKFSSFGEQQSLAEGFRNYLAEGAWNTWSDFVTPNYDKTGTIGGSEEEDQAEAENFTDEQLRDMLAGEYKRKGKNADQWKAELKKWPREKLLAAREQQKKSRPAREKKRTAVVKNKKRNRTLEPNWCWHV